jgi:hypothetical protein
MPRLNAPLLQPDQEIDLEVRYECLNSNLPTEQKTHGRLSERVIQDVTWRWPSQFVQVTQQGYLKAKGNKEATVADTRNAY